MKKRTQLDGAHSAIGGETDATIKRTMARPAFTIGIVQDHATSDTAANVARAENHIRAAVQLGAQIVCLKELFNAPYFCKAEQHERFDLAEPIPGPTTERLQKLAKELAVVIVAPLFEREAAGIYRNSAAVIDADGSLMGTYRKLHIPDDPLYYEKFYFTPGDLPGSDRLHHATGFRVWKTRYANVGVLICWDQWFPEAARIMALLGADVLFYPTAIGWHPSEKKEWGATQVDSWRTIQRAHAIANGIFVASPNRIGHEDEPGTEGITFFGNSFIADPSGRLIASAEQEETVLLAKCDPAEIESTRRNWPFLRDRRVDAYGPILQRYLAE
jgi:N-carbamoylputrescine amidase